MSEENVVALIMKRDTSLALELRLIMEQSPQHSGRRMTQSRSEIVQDHFRPVSGNLPEILLDLLSNLDIAEPEMSGRTLGQVGDEHAVGYAIVLVDDDDVGETLGDRLFDGLLDGRVFAPHWLRIRDNARELLHKRNRPLKKQNKKKV